MTSDALRERLAPIIAKRGQSALARDSGVSQPTISAWLSGRRPISDEALARVCAALGYRVETRYSLRRIG